LVYTQVAATIYQVLVNDTIITFTAFTIEKVEQHKSYLTYLTRITGTLIRPPISMYNIYVYSIQLLIVESIYKVSIASPDSTVHRIALQKIIIECAISRVARFKIPNI
jgi:hypothetical protein